MSFESAFKSIVSSIEDLSKLEVQTYTGTIDAIVEDATMDNILENPTTNAKLKLVASTTMCIDGDAKQFISNDSEVTESLHNAHVNTVTAAQKSRQATIQMFAAAIKKVVDKIDIEPTDS